MYLLVGTGKPCAWQRSAKLSETDCWNMLPFEAVENVGALEPTGSVIELNRNKNVR